MYSAITFFTYVWILVVIIGARPSTLAIETYYHTIVIWARLLMNVYPLMIGRGISVAGTIVPCPSFTYAVIITRPAVSMVFRGCQPYPGISIIW